MDLQVSYYGSYQLQTKTVYMNNKGTSSMCVGFKETSSCIVIVKFNHCQFQTDRKQIVQIKGNVI